VLGRVLLVGIWRLYPCDLDVVGWKLGGKVAVDDIG
jgi:hypothetical protein